MLQRGRRQGAARTVRTAAAAAATNNSTTTTTTNSTTTATTTNTTTTNSTTTNSTTTNSTTTTTILVVLPFNTLGVPQVYLHPLLPEHVPPLVDARDVAQREALDAFAARVVDARALKVDAAVGDDHGTGVRHQRRHLLHLYRLWQQQAFTKVAQEGVVKHEGGG